MTVVTRFAPSPSGDLHLGHVFAARFARDRARARDGCFRLRIDDLDVNCRAEYEQRNLGDLRWLGLAWDGPIHRQSARADRYKDALARLDRLGVTYPCFCTRKQIRAEIEASGQAPHSITADGSMIYPGTCRVLDPARRVDLMAGGRAYAVRLAADIAQTRTGPLTWTDNGVGSHAVALDQLGDVVIARKGGLASYHLACVIDDADQGVTLVTRGEDLLPVTPLHRTLQALLDLPQTLWHHHALCVDGAGRRLAKRHDALSVRMFRDAGYTPNQVFELAEDAVAR